MKSLQIQGTRTFVAATSTDIMRLAVQQDAMMMAFNPSGIWDGAVDKLLYRSSLGLRSDRPLQPFGLGKSSVFHDQLARLWWARQELADIAPAMPGEIVYTNGTGKAKDVPFRDVIFVLDPLSTGGERPALLPLGSILQTAFEAVISVEAVKHLCSPLIRGGLLAFASLDEGLVAKGFNREAIIRDHAHAIVCAARNYPDRELNYTLVFYNDKAGVEEFASAVESFPR